MSLSRRSWGPMLRALSYNRRDYRFLIFATAVGFTVVALALSVAGMFKEAAGFQAHLDFDRLAVAEIEADGALDAIADNLRALPSVESLAWVSHRPFTYSEFGEPVAPIDNSQEGPLSWPLPGDEHLLETMGLPLLAGRNFEPVVASGNADIEVVVTESLARAMSGKAPAGAVGARFINGVKGRIMRIVGVVPDVALHVSYVPDPMHGVFFFAPRVEGRRQFALLRVRDNGREALESAADALRADGGWVGVTSGQALHAVPDVNNRGGKLIQIVIIGAVLFVALIGNLGAASFSVAERARNIGIRRALGATRTDIMSYFLDENVFITTCGVALGLPIALGVAALATRLEEGFYVGWQHLGLSAALFYVTGLVAAHVPALLAARVPPSTASRAT